MTEHEHIQLAKDGDGESWEWLLKKHNGAIHKFCLKHARGGGDFDDALSHAHEAFINCVNRFDASQNIKFVTYLWSSLRMVGQAEKGGAIYVPPQTKHVDEARTAWSAVSMSTPIGDGNSVVGDLLSDGEQESDVDAEKLRMCISLLPERTANVIRFRMEGETLQDVADRHDLSREMVRQIEKQGHEQLRMFMSGQQTNTGTFYRPTRLREPWSRVEIATLRRLAGATSIVFAARAIGRSDSGTYRVARQHRIKSGKQQSWSVKEDMFLREHRAKGWQWCAKSLGRSATSIHNRVRRLGINLVPTAERSPDVSSVLALHRRGLTTTGISVSLGCSAETIRCLLNKMNVPLNPLDTTERCKAQQAALQKKYGVDNAAELREKKKAAAVERFRRPEWKDVSYSEVLILEAVRRIGKPATKHEIARELKTLKTETGWSWVPTMWQSVLRHAKGLVETGHLACHGTGRVLRRFQLSSRLFNPTEIS